MSSIVALLPLPTDSTFTKLSAFADFKSTSIWYVQFAPSSITIKATSTVSVLSFCVFNIAPLFIVSPPLLSFR